MKSYFNVSPLTGKPSGVKGYEYGEDYITIFFVSGKYYTYTIDSCGREHIENMKKLADSQHGLNTYITKNKPPYQNKG